MSTWFTWQVFCSIAAVVAITIFATYRWLSHTAAKSMSHKFVQIVASSADDAVQKARRSALDEIKKHAVVSLECLRDQHTLQLRTAALYRAAEEYLSTLEKEERTRPAMDAPAEEALKYAAFESLSSAVRAYKQSVTNDSPV